MDKIALITGITGQDGSILAETLHKKGYVVHGIRRRASTFNTSRINHLYMDWHESSNFFLHFGDLLDQSSLSAIIQRTKPNEIYHLASQSHVRVSFEQPIYTVDTICMGTINLLEAIRQIPGDYINTVRFYNAASSEMFGSTPPPQNETSSFKPRSPYACAKLYGYYQVLNYREAYGLFACNGILFNHTSEVRGETFVSRKITRAATRIKLGLQDKLYLGNLTAKRDFGNAHEYCEAMWLMLQQPTPDDFVIATGESHSILEFVEIAFGYLGLDWRKYVEIDPLYFRPTEVESLCGDASKAKRILGWEHKMNFKDIVKLLTDSDMKLANNEKKIKE
jgi:GDPmannose 4,6-dehydratase